MTKENNDKQVTADVRQTGSLSERLKRVKKTRWIRFGIVSLIFFGWVYWLGNPWVLLAWFLLADIYLTQFIPWNWWKYSKSNFVRTIMSWVDAIVYALILVYFLFAFVGQNYQIPSSSLEKTLLTGDFLWVNKMVYGPRVPQTPLHFPLAQNELFGMKSYIEHPQLKYHRLKGVRNVERGDIVVFNFPCGDTTLRAYPQGYTDYYSMVVDLGRENVLTNYGDNIVWRPVDRRDAYVKRCLGLPGEKISSKDGVVYINGKALDQPKNVQFFYTVDTDGKMISDDDFEELGIAVEDRHREQVNGKPWYFLPLTDEMAKKMRQRYGGNKVRRTQPGPDDKIKTFPAGYDCGWDHRTFGEIWIPKKGSKVELNDSTYRLYERCIRTYEGNKLEKKGDKYFINGKQATSYTFQMDYYWMMGDNRDNSLDSRYWGFVPEDHVIGTPMFILISFDKDKKLFDGWIRWNRIFSDANPDK